VFEYNSTNFYLDSHKPSKSDIVIFNFTDLKDKDSISYFYQLANQTANITPVVWVTNSKMMYSVGRYELNYPMITIDEKAYQKTETISLKINNKFISNYKNNNVIGYIPPAKKCKLRPTKYIVLSAHYDHLGKMGQAMFPGANDNASGVAMVLSLAKHYIDNPSEYGVILCFFSGEEAGLVGSEYFVHNPYFNLKKVKFQLNIDIMGGASKGITLVNGSVLKEQFELMETINNEKNYLPLVKKRGETANSDHHHFTKSGVPAFFIYSMGTVLNYHDIYDKAENTPLTNFDEVQQLLLDFVNKL
jgi:Zn-dependent M28 family amino/carboxypeptidase